MTLVTLLGSAAMLALLIGGFNFALHRSLVSDQESLLRSRADAELGTLASNGPKLTHRRAVDDAAVDGLVWVYNARHVSVERPAASAASQKAADRLALRGRGEAATGDIRLRAVPVSSGGRHLGIVVAGISLAPYGRAQNFALLASIALGVIVLAGIGFASRAIAGRALRPVAHMTAQAADWSEHDLDRRFSMHGPADELTHLAATFDRLLDRVASSLRHERRFSAEISHELRTPLATLTAEAELALRAGKTSAQRAAALGTVLDSALTMERTLDTLLAAARADARLDSGTCNATEAVRAAATLHSAGADTRGVEIAIDAPEPPLRAGVDTEVVERVLGPLIDNACRYAGSRVDLKVVPAFDELRIHVTDDGPGIPQDELCQVFDPGVRGSNANGSRGAGLGLALSRRLARAVGGDVSAAEGPGGRLTVRLPAA